MQKTIRTYFRPEPRCPMTRQQSVAEKFDGKVIPYENINEWISQMRPRDVVGVPYYHRLASNAEDLKAVRDRLKAFCVVVLEIDTGRRSDNPDDLADMVDEARTFYARNGMTTAEAKRLGALGAKASPVTKSKSNERLPVEMAEKILNDHETYPTLPIAYHVINNARNADGKKFKRKWYPSLVTRLAKQGKIHIKLRRSGPKCKQ